MLREWIGRLLAPAGETPHETASRGASWSPALARLYEEREAPAALVAGLGFLEVSPLEGDATAGGAVAAVAGVAFLARAPMAGARGATLVRILPRSLGAVGRERVLAFAAEVRALRERHDVRRGMLLTCAAFTLEAWTAAEAAPIELVDGKHARTLMGIAGWEGA